MWFWWTDTHPRWKLRRSEMLIREKNVGVCVQCDYIISNSLSTVFYCHPSWPGCCVRSVFPQMESMCPIKFHLCLHRAGMNVWCSHQCSQTKPNAFVVSRLWRGKKNSLRMETNSALHYQFQNWDHAALLWKYVVLTRATGV